ncbi:MAG: zinc ribbon domain-containing protein [Alistipes sp.]|nr:zinc ribbon domain-containing protein [Alistipes sp.]
MAIIQCPNCGSSISDLAEACPKCGAAVTKSSGQGLEWYWWIILLCTGWIVSLIFYLVQKNKSSLKAKQSLICLGINLGFWVLMYVIGELFAYEEVIYFDEFYY